MVTCLVTEWSGIPDLVAEWDDWDELSRLDFVLEWPIQEDRLGQLRDWADRNLPSDERLERFDALLKRIAIQRPTLEKLLEDYIDGVPSP